MTQKFAESLVIAHALAGRGQHEEQSPASADAVYGNRGTVDSGPRKWQSMAEQGRSWFARSCLSFWSFFSASLGGMWVAHRASLSQVWLPFPEAVFAGGLIFAAPVNAAAILVVQPNKSPGERIAGFG